MGEAEENQPQARRRVKHSVVVVWTYSKTSCVEPSCAEGLVNLKETLDFQEGEERWIPVGMNSTIEEE